MGGGCGRPHPPPAEAASKLSRHERLRASVGGFVDVHSHVVPSGDDGARSLEDAVQLCRLALAGGTRVLYATPHVHAEWDQYPLTPKRRLLFDEAFPVVSRVVSAWGLELRRGWEVFPTVLRDRDPHEFLLEGTAAVLMEFPGSWLDLGDDSSLVLEAAERLTAAGLVPVIAHPERSLGLWADFGIARALVDRGCLLCANGDSALGDNGPVAEEAFRKLVDEGLIALVASDGHKQDRPPRLDHVHDVLVERYGAGSIEKLFDGSALPWVSRAHEPSETGRPPLEPTPRPT
jgi:protein-tyrosine phosphatase